MANDFHEWRKGGSALTFCVLAAAMLVAPAHAQSTAAAAAPAVGANLLGEYRINPGDELDISVWGEERMQRTVRVLSDGTFAFPLAGTIVAANRTVKDVSGTIRERIAGNYRTSVPDVTVGVRAAADMSFYVVGKVRTPGTYATGRPINVVQALSMAGGLAEFADVNNAVILRQTPNGQVVEPVKLARVLKGQRRLEAGALTQPLPILRSGDVLVIP
ncbi:polysaccharide biosynthesis/export family protein [Sphingomonas sp. SUN019]|uniref:polysaccharide biosynthesis/export family protein n=1 Tax=Sphingomonas sp. SUN019 TaxID=2937788 RepID=UPI0021643034|nr:polysaccharide biosynthesis/export family protein [Sphingomonas sp. SUN019]UVO51473.1 polysaccharide biosynthesis/export family protein [Sphingomonas sp. SUN019]